MLYDRIPSTNYRRNDEVRKSWMDVKTCGWNTGETMLIFCSSKYFPTNYILNYKRMNNNFQGEIMENTTLTKFSKLTSPTLGQTNIMNLKIWCTDKKKNISLEVFLPNTYKQCSHEKTTDKFKLGTFYKITILYF